MSGAQTLGEGQTNKGQIRKEYKSYSGDNFLITRRYKIRYTFDCR